MTNYRTEYEQEADRAIPQIELWSLPWPELDYYNSDHGRHTMYLAITMLNAIEDRGDTDDKLSARALMTAGLIHDVGRRRDWRKEDPDHAHRSAQIAEDALKRTPDWADDKLRERCCRLIAQHDISRDPREISDPLAQALHDADCYESARIAPKTGVGQELFLARTSNDRLCIEWSKQIENKRHYLASRWSA